MAIKGPQGIIGSALGRLRQFNLSHAKGDPTTEGEVLTPKSRPLEEIPGTKAHFEAFKPGVPENPSQGEKKG